VSKLRNTPPTILVAALLIAVGAMFNFALGLIFSLTPEILVGIEEPTTTSGAPTQLLIVAGVACIAFGFVFVWILRELINKSQFVLVMIYALSIINILFGFFRMPVGMITIFLNLLVIFLIRTNSAKQWLSSS
jgi:hypothetical protein